MTKLFSIESKPDAYCDLRKSIKPQNLKSRETCANAIGSIRNTKTKNRFKYNTINVNKKKTWHLFKTR